MIIGSTPVLFLPETLKEAKDNKARYRCEASPDAAEASDNSEGRIDPFDKRSMLQEAIRRVHEFKDATEFIWRDYSVCIMVLSCLIALVSRQSSTVFLQYVSKKFNWSIARVCTSRISHMLASAKVTTGQPLDFTAWNIQSHHLSHHHARSVVRRDQVSQPTWQPTRLSFDPRERNGRDYWPFCHGPRAGSSLARHWNGIPLPRLCVSHHCPQSGDQSGTSRPCRHALLGPCDHPIPRHPGLRPIIRLFLPDRLTSWRDVDGNAFRASWSSLYDFHHRHVVCSCP